MEKYNVPEPNSLDSMEGVIPNEKKTEVTERETFEKGYSNGYEKGSINTIHDFSKDIGMITLSFSEYKKDISEKMSKIRNISFTKEGLSNLSPEDLKNLKDLIDQVESAPSTMWANLISFKSMELSAVTSMTFRDAPLECAKLIGEGSLRDLYGIIRTFVVNDTLKRNPLEQVINLNAVAKNQSTTPDYSSIRRFEFDHEPTLATKSFFEKLGNQVKKLLDLEQADRKGRFHYPFIVSPGLTDDLGDTENWDQKIFTHLEAVSTERLIPFLVYSLRFAFNSCDSTIILKELDHGLPIKITQFGDVESFILLDDGTKFPRYGGVKISFELPVNKIPENKAEIPYLESFLKNCSKFEYLTFPWRQPEVEFVDNTATITIEYSL